MMILLRCLAIALLIAPPSLAHCDTWDEPWQERVITLADAFVLARVTACTPTEVQFDLVKQLAGQPVPPHFIVDGYSLLGGKLEAADTEHHHHTDFDFAIGAQTYLLLRKDPAGDGYQLPTPTSGWADVHDDGVYATYRHTYHKAVVAPALYETTMTALFQRLRQQPVDEAPIRAVIDDALHQLPSTWHGDADDRESRDRFFRQHVALELLRAFGKESDLDRIEPFLVGGSWHLQISACRALAGIVGARSRERMLAFVEGGGDAFAKVMCVWGLRDQGARDAAPRLRAWLSRGGEDACGFGGNIMDPRVGTRFPSTSQQAVSELLAMWESKPAP